MTERGEMLFLNSVILVAVVVIGFLASCGITFYWPNGGPFWVEVRQYFLAFIVICLLNLAVRWSRPRHNRKIEPTDAVVAGFATLSALVFVSTKWAAPALEATAPHYLPITQGIWPHILTILSAAFASIAVTRLLNARIARFAANLSTRIEKETVANVVLLWTFVTVALVPVLRSIYWSGLEAYVGGVSGKTYITRELYIASGLLLLIGAGFLFFSRDRSMRSIGGITEGNRNGYPSLNWSQIVGTSETVASKDGQRRFKIYWAVIAVAALAGIAKGSAEDAVFYAVVAAWLGAFGLRGAGKFAMQGHTLVHVPHTKTDDERREELTPVTRHEDCEAFLEQVDGKLWFCVARGTASDGPLPVVERVPFDSFGNFEEGSHKQWFRPRGTVDQTLDWGVIVAQSSVGRIVLVAQSLGEQAWLIELLVKLQSTFIGPRDAMLQALKEAEHKRRAHQEPEGRRGTAVDDAPIKPF